MRIILLCLILAGCGLQRKNEPKPDPMTPEEQLREDYHARLDSIDWGIPSRLGCDGALWSGVAASGGVDLDLTEHEYPEAGQIQRRPDYPCWPDDLDGNGAPDSRSTVSSDMIIGILLGAYYQGDSDLPERIFRYGSNNDWFMGEPSSALGEVVLKPNVQIVLNIMVHGSSGTPTVYLPVTEDYQHHIQALLIHLEGLVAGRISDNALGALKSHPNAFPDDYLFHAILGQYTGSQAKSMALLLGGINPSSYVRGAQPERYALANWLLAARITLDSIERR